MCSAVALNSSRPVGSIRQVKFDVRPNCKYCGKPLVIRDSSKPRIIVDLFENMPIIISYYQCNKFSCEGKKMAYIVPVNPFAPLKGEYSYQVLAKICHLRWQKHLTYDEICTFMKSEYQIVLSRTTVENALKIYEIGASHKYIPEYSEKIQKNGGIILTIDGMAPLKGHSSLYVAYDYNSGLTLVAKRLSDQKTETIETFLNQIKNKIDSQLEVPVCVIISDALVAQLMAIENVFPGLPHCLCHFHFFKLILVNSMNQDSQITTFLRKRLRKQSDIKSFKEKRLRFDTQTQIGAAFQYIFEGLIALSNWKRHPKDPCFSGLIFYQRITDILEQIREIISIPNLDLEPILDKTTRERLVSFLSDLLNESAVIAGELSIIHEYLEESAEILGNLDTSFNVGLRHIRKLRDRLRKRRFSEKCGPIEKNFIEELMKFIRTKGELLFNYKRVSGAPTTNNAHELKYKQLKHFLRRVIGFAAAKKYLLYHGERIVFINKDESLQSIILILQNTDFESARKTIEDERQPRNGLPNIMHYRPKWDEYIHRIKKIIHENFLGNELCI